MKSLPQRGVLILKVTKERLDEVFKLRRVVETLTMEELSVFIAEEDLGKLRGLLERQKQFAQQQDREGFLEVDEEFHLLLPELARLPKTREIIKNLRDQIHLVGFEALSHPGRMQEVIQEHQEMTEALSRHDAEAAKNALLEHLSHTEAALAQGQQEAERQ